MRLTPGDGTLGGMCRISAIIGAALLLSALVLGGCGRPYATTESGFLTDYGPLEEETPGVLSFRAAPERLRRYQAFIVDPIEVRLEERPERVDDDDRAKLTAHFDTQIRAALGERFEIVGEAGEHVGRVRAAVTRVERSAPLLNIHPASKLSGVGLGGAAIEGEIVDSVSGELLVARVVARRGDRLSFDGLSKWGDAKSVMSAWARHVGQTLDEVHASAAGGVQAGD